jgi:hypothetical protein
MAVTPKLCVLTVHGIGFQQPPHHGLPGYADVLHGNLAPDLGDLLGTTPTAAPPDRAARPRCTHHWGSYDANSAP